MGKVRDYVRGSKVGRAVVTTMGVGGFLGLVFTLTLWAASYAHLIYLSCGLTNDYRSGLGVIRGLTIFHVFEVPLQPIGLRLEFIEASDRVAINMLAHLDSQPFRFEFFGAPGFPVEIIFPLWSLALFCLSALAAAFALSFRFTIRSLLVASTFSCLLLGGLAILIQRAQ